MTKSPTRTFWARVKEALEDARLPPTQAYIARKLGVTQPAITLWNKDGFPTIENTITLARLLNVNVEWLLTERGPKRPPPQDALAQEIWAAWAHLDDATKGRLAGIAGEVSGQLQRLSETNTPEEHRRA